MLTELLSYVLHLDQHLAQLLQQYGGWLYLWLGLVVFIESGIVLLPLLPGDSLLFAAGTVCALNPSAMNVWLLQAVLVFAATVGNFTNYYFGRTLGRSWVMLGRVPWIKPVHLQQAQEFYERRGFLAIVLARFMPMVRTFAPFIAGSVAAPLLPFVILSSLGALAWVDLMVLSGYCFGQLPWIQARLHWLVLTIVLVSLVPLLLEYYRQRAAQSQAVRSHPY